MGLLIKEKNLLEKVSSQAKKKKIKIYLVGGFLRDLILKRAKINIDIDFSLKKDSIKFGRELAVKLGSGFVVLDKEHGCCRLLKKIGEKTYTLDFTDFRAQTITDDLYQRDFTINALALALDDIFTRPCANIEESLLDPYGGRKDLKLKMIRMVSKKGFDDDPLRILRAFSLAAIFGFKIEKKTLGLIRLKRSKLADVSFERIRDELFKILTLPDAYYHILDLDKLKILKIIIPEIEEGRGVNQGPYHHLDILKHNLETIRQLEIALPEFKRSQEIQDYLNKVISSERRRYALMKLGALLHDIGKPRARRRKEGKIIFHGHERLGVEMTRAIAARLKLSNDELEALEKMVFWHLRPGYLADNQALSPRAKFRYFRDTAEEAVSTLLVALADQRATRGRLTTRESRLRHERLVASLIREYFRKKKEKKPVRLINGNDLMNKFKLAPSPLIGKILSEIEELQAIGKLKTRPEAFTAAKRILKKGG